MIISDCLLTSPVIVLFYFLLIYLYFLISKFGMQVAMLNARVNIACGTPSRIKKLIDIEALSLSRLKLVVLDMQKDAKSFNLFTLPQVSNEFWDLYKGYLDPKVREGNTRICFYGAVSERDITKALPPAE